MVKAIFTCDQELGILEMRVQGHADFAEMGKDPVCAGASVLAMAAAQTVDIMNGERKLKDGTVIHVAGGNVRVQCAPKEEYFGEALLVLYVAQVGFGLLEAAYPEYVRLTPFEPAELAVSE